MFQFPEPTQRNKVTGLMSVFHIPAGAELLFLLWAYFVIFAMDTGHILFIPGLFHDSFNCLHSIFDVL